MLALSRGSDRRRVKRISWLRERRATNQRERNASEFSLVVSWTHRKSELRLNDCNDLKLEIMAPHSAVKRSRSAPFAPLSGHMLAHKSRIFKHPFAVHKIPSCVFEFHGFVLLRINKSSNSDKNTNDEHSKRCQFSFWLRQMLQGHK